MTERSGDPAIPHHPEPARVWNYFLGQLRCQLAVRCFLGLAGLLDQLGAQGGVAYATRTLSPSRPMAAGAGAGVRLSVPRSSAAP